MSAPLQALRRLGAPIVTCGGCDAILRTDNAEQIEASDHPMFGLRRWRVFICTGSHRCFERLRERNPNAQYERWYVMKPDDKVQVIYGKIT